MIDFPQSTREVPDLQQPDERSGEEGPTARADIKPDSEKRPPSNVAVAALIVSLAGFAIAASNLYLTQLRKAKIELYVGQDMAIYYPRDGGFGMYVPLTFINRTQRGGVAMRTRARLYRVVDDDEESFEFEWANFMSRDPATRQYRTSDEAAPLAVPASSAVSKNVWFVWRPDAKPTFELKPGSYEMTFSLWTSADARPDVENVQHFTIGEALAATMLEFRSRTVPETRYVIFRGGSLENDYGVRRH